MPITPDLLHASSTNQTLIDYDRCRGGSFDNPYEGIPSISFAMQRVKIVDGSDTLISSSSLPAIHEGYVPGKTYQMMNPATGLAIPGVTFTADQMYAMLWSMMYAKLTAINAATAALATAQAAYDAAQATSPAAQSVLITAEAAARVAPGDTAAAAAFAAAQTAYQATVVALQTAAQNRSVAQQALNALG